MNYRAEWPVTHFRPTRATERLGEYDLAAARKVFEVLAPVLPAGVPAKPASWSDDVPWLMVAEDAATRR
jgi:hypothetical protein